MHTAPSMLIIHFPSFMCNCCPIWSNTAKVLYIDVQFKPDFHYILS